MAKGLIFYGVEYLREGSITTGQACLAFRYICATKQKIKIIGTTISIIWLFYLVVLCLIWMPSMLIPIMYTDVNIWTYFISTVSLSLLYVYCLCTYIYSFHKCSECNPIIPLYKICTPIYYVYDWTTLWFDLIWAFTFFMFLRRN